MNSNKPLKEIHQLAGNNGNILPTVYKKQLKEQLGKAQLRQKHLSCRGAVRPNLKVALIQEEDSRKAYCVCFLHADALLWKRTKCISSRPLFLCMCLFTTFLSFPLCVCMLSFPTHHRLRIYVERAITTAAVLEASIEGGIGKCLPSP